MDFVLEDIAVDDGPVLYVVRPEKPNGAGVLYLHWFDEAPNANRTQFLEEAEILAGAGVTAVLPQLTFPWQTPPTDTTNDLVRIRAEVAGIRDTFADLSELERVDPSRLALVGHDFGAMHGMALFGEVEMAAAVLIAPTPRWSDWFLRFWPIDADRYDYMRALSEVDPISTVTAATCPLLFQFGMTDFYIAAMTGLELFEAAPEPKEIVSYDCGHEMDLAGIRTDRIAFLSGRLGLD